MIGRTLAVHWPYTEGRRRSTCIQQPRIVQQTVPHNAETSALNMRYKTLKITQVICACYILTMTFRYYPKGLIDPSGTLSVFIVSAFS